MERHSDREAAQRREEHPSRAHILAGWISEEASSGVDITERKLVLILRGEVLACTSSGSVVHHLHRPRIVDWEDLEFGSGIKARDDVPARVFRGRKIDIDLRR